MNTGSIFTLDINTGALTKILTGPQFLNVSWSPTGTALVYNRSTQGQLTTHYFNPKLKNSFVLPLSGNVSTCSWSGNENTLFCPVEKGIAQISLAASSQLTQLLTPGNLVVGRSLFFYEPYLFFWDDLTNNLYRLAL